MFKPKSTKAGDAKAGEVDAKGSKAPADGPGTSAGPKASKTPEEPSGKSSKEPSGKPAKGETTSDAKASKVMSVPSTTDDAWSNSAPAEAALAKSSKAMSHAGSVGAKAAKAGPVPAEKSAKSAKKTPPDSKAEKVPSKEEAPAKSKAAKEDPVGSSEGYREVVTLP